MSDTVTVTVDGRDERAPDLASVDLRVRSTDPDVGTARAATDRRSEVLFETLADHQVPEEATNTTNYRVSRERDHTQRPPVEGDYVVTHHVHVESADLDDVGDLLADCIDDAEAGLSSLSYTLREATEREAKSAALTDAMALARDRAATLAAAEVRSVGAVQSVTAGDASATEVRTVEAAQESGTTRVGPRPGPVETTVTVTVTYALE
ncbi:SIMPL domain-containing protein [Halomarina salina]|uniref:SIMPL domain-containing protein n=1 Tax=Halomarina salina TaxID=1872699 RepID=A0ABD5RNY6_9EURY|nr:SIMPL domain-containing protein [Halomarina salina]